MCSAASLSGDGRFLPRLQQDKAMALFRANHCNLLFTTNVAEEGLDIQNCSLVICYNVPKTPLSLVQTVGRARARNAQVVFMEEVGTGGAAKAVRVPLCTVTYSTVSVLNLRDYGIPGSAMTWCLSLWCAAHLLL